MQREGYVYTERIAEADVILINTCSIRDNAEQRIWGRLAEMKRYRRERPGLVVGVIGCMAERLRERLTEGPGGVDVVAGPDAYRDLPRLVRAAEAGSKGVNVRLSAEETYAEIAPVRLDRNGVSAFVAIMRGCNNFCSYCVVPYTRGRERSRDPETIVAEARSLFENGYREVTLLGQNVNSYRAGEVGFPEPAAARGVGLAAAARALRHVAPEGHERPAAGDDGLDAQHLPGDPPPGPVGRDVDARAHEPQIHARMVSGPGRRHPPLPARLRRDDGPHRRILGETEEEHLQTLSLMREVGYEFAYMFKYSERPGTFAQKHLPDDVPDEVKSRRLQEIIALQNELGLASNRRDVGREFEVLVEGRIEARPGQLSGRTSQNKVVVFDRGTHGVGDYVRVRITGCTPATLLGEEVPAAG